MMAQCCDGTVYITTSPQHASQPGLYDDPRSRSQAETQGLISLRSSSISGVNLKLHCYNMLIVQLMMRWRWKTLYSKYRRITFRLRACSPQFSLYHLEKRMSKAQKINPLYSTESVKLTLRAFWSLCTLHLCRSFHFRRICSSWYRIYVIYKHERQAN